MIVIETNVGDVSLRMDYLEDREDPKILVFTEHEDGCDEEHRVGFRHFVEEEVADWLDPDTGLYTKAVMENLYGMLTVIEDVIDHVLDVGTLGGDLDRGDNYLVEEISCALQSAPRPDWEAMARYVIDRVRDYDSEMDEEEDDAADDE